MMQGVPIHRYLQLVLLRVRPLGNFQMSMVGSAKSAASRSHTKVVGVGSVCASCCMGGERLPSALRFTVSCLDHSAMWPLLHGR